MSGLPRGTASVISCFCAVASIVLAACTQPAYTYERECFDEGRLVYSDSGSGSERGPVTPIKWAGADHVKLPDDRVIKGQCAVRVFKSGRLFYSKRQGAV